MEHLRALILWLPLVASFATLVTPFGDVHADGFEITFFNIDHDVETGALAITHRFFEKDIQIALSEIEGMPIIIDASAALEAVVRPYIEARFSLTTLDGTELDIRWVDAEWRAGTLLIRQRALLSPSAEALIVRNEALHETHPKHVNMMHATLGGSMHRRDFLAGGGTSKAVD